MITRARYIDNQRIIRNRMIKEFAPRVASAIQSQIHHAILAVRRDGVRMARGKIHGHITNQEIGNVIRDLYRRAAIDAKAKYRANIKSAQFGRNQDFIDSVIEYLNKYLLDKVVLPISQTTIAYIDRVLDNAIQEGWSIDRTVKELEDSDITKNRARLIVRTESVRATNFAQIAAADDEPYEMNKEWIAVEDFRTRRSHSHAGVDEEKQKLTDPFTNGLMFPGDPNGPAEEVCNCRCTMGYSAVRDANNRPIMKNRGEDFLTRMSLGRLK